MSLCFSKLASMSGMDFSNLDVVATIDVDLMKFAMMLGRDLEGTRRAKETCERC